MSSAVVRNTTKQRYGTPGIFYIANWGGKPAVFPEVFNTIVSTLKAVAPLTNESRLRARVPYSHGRRERVGGMMSGTLRRGDVIDTYMRFMGPVPHYEYCFYRGMDKLSMRMLE